jgi:hypothetical protein
MKTKLTFITIILLLALASVSCANDRSRLIGTWYICQEDITFEYIFNRNGTMMWKMSGDGEVYYQSGTFTVSGDQLTTTIHMSDFDDYSVTDTIRFRFEGRNTLVLINDAFDVEFTLSRSR